MLNQCYEAYQFLVEFQETNEGTNYIRVYDRAT